MMSSAGDLTSIVVSCHHPLQPPLIRQGPILESFRRFCLFIRLVLIFVIDEQAGELMIVKVDESMLELVVGDITRQDTEAVVNAANKRLADCQ